jgi:UDP-N-acetylglucosamine 2-epimerase (non-hydrolysing)
MKNAWLIVSDSGGVQEEAPGLGAPLFILRENTERPEAIEAGAAKLVGRNSLKKMLEFNYNNEDWINSLQSIKNPFGDGTSAKKIIKILKKELPAKARTANGRIKIAGEYISGNAKLKM